MIEIELLRGWGDEPTFKSLAAAIAHSASEARLARAEEDAALIAGATIVNVAWESAESVAIGLSNGFRLDVFCRGGVVQWSLARGSVTERFVSEDDVRVTLVRDDGSRASRTENPAALLKARVGRSVQKLFAGTGWFYVYVEGVLILLFMSRERTRGEGRILVWGDTK
ncbi:MAG: hypothetical protein HYR85_12800 [Planctomycetes bacterium]|nr:hypothetical protein [Planctomycetota bacterium]MBI3846330.1 hypothetical protein [Planctomycetota bacterium]